MSLTSVDLPDPETPVTATRQPSGNETSMSLQVVLAGAADGDHLAGARVGAGPGPGWSACPRGTGR